MSHLSGGADCTVEAVGRLMEAGINIGQLSAGSAEAGSIVVQSSGVKNVHSIVVVCLS